LDCAFSVDSCEWTTTSPYAWTRYKGSTPSGSTGPVSDHTGNNGHYMYTEASARYGKTFDLVSPVLRLADDCDLSFWYHMYGSNMGTLSVKAGTSTLWSQSGQQQTSKEDAWKEATVTVPLGTTKLTFEGVTGTSYKSDMAVDDITLRLKQAHKPSQTPCTESACTQCSVCLEEIDEFCSEKWGGCIHVDLNCDIPATITQCTGVVAGPCLYALLCHDPCICTDWKDVYCETRTDGDCNMGLLQVKTASSKRQQISNHSDGAGSAGAPTRHTPRGSAKVALLSQATEVAEKDHSDAQQELQEKIAEVEHWRATMLDLERADEEKADVANTNETMHKRRRLPGNISSAPPVLIEDTMRGKLCTKPK